MPACWGVCSINHINKSGAAAMSGEQQSDQSKKIQKAKSAITALVGDMKVKFVASNSFSCNCSRYKQVSLTGTFQWIHNQ